MSEWAKECNICYESVSSDHFFILGCCRGKGICKDCLECLRIPLCPYCRSIIPEVKNNPKYRMACSYVPVSNFMLYEQANFLSHHGLVEETIDPRHIGSRILRRRIRRLRRLQMRGLL